MRRRADFRSSQLCCGHVRTGPKNRPTFTRDAILTITKTEAVSRYVPYYKDEIGGIVEEGENGARLKNVRPKLRHTLVKCYIGFCTPTRTEMDSKKGMK